MEMDRAYKTFMAHAKKLTRNAKRINPHIKVIQGVLHRTDGKLVVTDAHRLYVFNSTYEGEEKVIDPITNRRVIGKYPDVQRLIPDSYPDFSADLNVDEYLKATDIVNVVSNSYGVATSMKYEKNILSSNYNDEMTAEVTVSVEIPEHYKFFSDGAYWMDALRMFKAFKYTEVKFDYYGAIRPFVLTSEDDKLTALILPIRRY